MDRRDHFERLHQVLDDAGSMTPLCERRLQTARSLRKGDVVFVPRFRKICEVKAISKGKEILTVSLDGISTSPRFCSSSRR